MMRAVFVAVALVLLSACATAGPIETGRAAPASFDAAPVESMVLTSVRALERRRFSSPRERQPDLRPILATTIDRARRRARRRRIIFAKAQRP